MVDSRPHIRAFTDARRVSAPFVVVRTPDQFQSRADLFTAALEMKQPPTSILLAWDAARGLTAPVNGQQDSLTALLAKAGLKQQQTLDLTETLLALTTFAPLGMIVALHNAHRHWEKADVAQALANFRDEGKRSFRMLVALVPMGVNPPDEIKHDCIMLDVPLPTADELRQIVERTITGAGVTADGDHYDRATNGVRGLSAFVAETATAMALRKAGVNFDALLEQRIAAIQQVKGVTVYRGGETFADIVGLDGIKRDLARLKTAKRKVRVVVVFDEFEKALGGSQAEHGDSTGIKPGISGHLLTWMQNKKTRGIIAFGHPGTGKSLAGKALANELGCICIMADLNAMLGGIVGTSEQNVRAFTDLVDAIAGEEGAFLLATCNSTGVLTTELRRRFNRGMYFFDLALALGRDAAWRFYCKRHGLDANQPRPQDDGWTPAEIAVCCEKADDYGISLVDAAESVVPVAMGQPEVIEARRKEAHLKLLDAETGRPYRMPGSVGASTMDSALGRAIAAMPEL